MQSGLRFRMVRSVFKFDDSTALKGSDLNMTVGFINRKVSSFLSLSVSILCINIILSGFKEKDRKFYAVNVLYCLKVL